MLALARHLPRLAARIPWLPLGDWPTPLERLELAGGAVWIKREGASSPRYGGNKVRTLEPWLGHARQAGAHRIWAIGAFGSNHTIATALHAPAGLEVGAIVFPQPASPWAIENCGALLAAGASIVRLHNVVELPFAALRVARRDRGAILMPPGGATPIGTFGPAAAVFELAEQLAAGAAPPPRRIVLPVGSTCTTAGLVVGLLLAHAAGIWRWPLPLVHAVRVTRCPVTSALVVGELAARTLARAAALGGPRVASSRGELLARFVVDRREIGAGYGRVTPRARAAIAAWTGPRLDGVYSGKAAAALLRLHRAGLGPLLFWATKSEVELPPPPMDRLRAAPAALVRWLGRG
ncbi:MAG TPA: pyridoxal-phosphate dependent enzyme [Kofleriaceae bacterium]|nr:pyridoxal-phosphate dependent enzyme [Kofleriaceae bacterium]